MNFNNYAEMVYFQFYRKVEELDFYITNAFDNAQEYKVAPIPKDNIYFDRMQFYFSAYINALASTWEIAKLSIVLSNRINDLPKRHDLISENKLEDDRLAFSNYFHCDPEIGYWFQFMKDARNANTHDGSLSLNSGNVQQFLFQPNLCRFKLNRESQSFIYMVSESPRGDAVAAMLIAALHLVPIFETKLHKPRLSMEDRRAMAEFQLTSVPGLLDNFHGMEDKLVESMLKIQSDMPQKRDITKESRSWWNKLCKIGFSADQFLQPGLAHP